MATVSVCFPHGFSLLGAVAVSVVGEFSSDWLSGELVTVEDGVGVDDGRWVEVGAEVGVAVGAAVSDAGGPVCVGEGVVDEGAVG